MSEDHPYPQAKHVADLATAGGHPKPDFINEDEVTDALGRRFLRVELFWKLPEESPR